MSRPTQLRKQRDKEWAKKYTEEMIENVESEVGMGHKAWDDVHPFELFDAILKVCGKTNHKKNNGGTRITIRLTTALRSKFEKQAALEDRSLSRVIVRTLLAAADKTLAAR